MKYSFATLFRPNLGYVLPGRDLDRVQPECGGKLSFLKDTYNLLSCAIADQGADFDVPAHVAATVAMPTSCVSSAYRLYALELARNESAFFLRELTGSTQKLLVLIFATCAGMAEAFQRDGGNVLRLNVLPCARFVAHNLRMRLEELLPLLDCGFLGQVTLRTERMYGLDCYVVCFPGCEVMLRRDQHPCLSFENHTPSQVREMLAFIYKGLHNRAKLAHDPVEASCMDEIRFLYVVLDHVIENTGGDCLEPERLKELRLAIEMAFPRVTGDRDSSTVQDSYDDANAAVQAYQAFFDRNGTVALNLRIHTLNMALYATPAVFDLLKEIPAHLSDFLDRPFGYIPPVVPNLHAARCPDQAYASPGGYRGQTVLHIQTV